MIIKNSILKHAVEDLQRIRDEPAGNYAEVVMSASVIRQAVEFWLQQAQAAVEDEAAS